MSGLHWFSSYFIRKVFAKDICQSAELLIIISLTPCLTIAIRNRRDTEPECLRISWCLKSCGCSGSMALLDVRKNHSAIAYSCKERKKEKKNLISVGTFWKLQSRFSLPPHINTSRERLVCSAPAGRTPAALHRLGSAR